MMATNRTYATPQSCTNLPSQSLDQLEISSFSSAVQQKNDRSRHCNAISSKKASTARKSIGCSWDRSIDSQSRELDRRFRPGQYDVICARGREAKYHTGNQHLRSLIESALEQYSAAKGKLQKTIIVWGIVNEVRTMSPGGGFVKLVGGKWYEVGDHRAREKVGQAFRDRLFSQYRSSSRAKHLMRKHFGEVPSKDTTVRSGLGDLLPTETARKAVCGHHMGSSIAVAEEALWDPLPVLDDPDIMICSDYSWLPSMNTGVTDIEKAPTGSVECKVTASADQVCPRLLHGDNFPDVLAHERQTVRQPSNSCVLLPRSRLAVHSTGKPQQYRNAPPNDTGCSLFPERIPTRFNRELPISLMRSMARKKKKHTELDSKRRRAFDGLNEQQVPDSKERNEAE